MLSVKRQEQSTAYPCGWKVMMVLVLAAILSACSNSSTTIPATDFTPESGEYPPGGPPLTELASILAETPTARRSSTYWSCSDDSTGVGTETYRAFVLGADGMGFLYEDARSLPSDDNDYATAIEVRWSLVLASALSMDHDGLNVPQIYALAKIYSTDDIAFAVVSADVILGTMYCQRLLLPGYSPSLQASRFVNGATVASAQNQWQCEVTEGPANSTAILLAADGTGTLTNNGMPSAISSWETAGRSIRMSLADGSQVRVSAQRFQSQTEFDGFHQIDRADSTPVNCRLDML